MTKHRFAVAFLLTAALLLGGCSLATAPDARPPTSPPPWPPAQADDQPLPVPGPAENGAADAESAAAAVIAALAANDYVALADLVHPLEAVRFSPYGYVINDGPDQHLQFSAESLSAPGFADESFTWGKYDGSGEDIDLTVSEYFEQFVYDQDYADAPQIAWNEVIGTGNTLLNHEDVYPEAQFVEYYFPGSEEYAGMDWSSLRLALQEHQGRWYVVGIIHGQWTI